MELFVKSWLFTGFISMGVMFLIWSVKVSKLFTYLRKNHPDEYDAMGKPTLLANTPKSTANFLKFIRSDKPSELNDNHLITQCSFLKKFFTIYLCLFFSVIVAMLTSWQY